MEPLDQEVTYRLRHCSIFREIAPRFEAGTQDVWQTFRRDRGSQVKLAASFNLLVNAGTCW
jgi:hypothetical protein